MQFGSYSCIIVNIKLIDLSGGVSMEGLEAIELNYKARNLSVSFDKRKLSAQEWIQ